VAIRTVAFRCTLLALAATALVLRPRHGREECQSCREGSQERVHSSDVVLATLAHELRGPLTAMIGWLDLARGSRDEAVLRKAVEVALRNARQQVRIVNDLHDLARIATGKLSMHRESIGLERVVQEACEGCRPAALERGIQLHCDAYENVPVDGDEQRLVQMLGNLISNAVKFNHIGGWVRVSLRSSEGLALLTVEDGGSGIAAEDLPHIFGRFWQAHAHGDAAHPGMGLGLAIVEHIVGLHGGSITVHSDGIGCGTRFEVQLPVLPFHFIEAPSSVDLQSAAY
jgi:signal transduction histidine kinase